VNLKVIMYLAVAYLLSGLPVPRCPECGQRFDPARLQY
jgi:hypothetical protein